jgi:hypothetical protein
MFYEKEVRPILKTSFPKLKYSAAVFGWGSEVLGYDTPLSRDHHWGPKVFLFLSKQDYKKFKPHIYDVLAENLPYQFMGYSTNYSAPEPNGVRHAVPIAKGPVSHLVDIYTIKKFFERRLQLDPYQTLQPLDWLVLPQQRLLEMVSGEVYYDGLKELGKVREKFSYFPKDVWLYLLASQWTRIAQEEAFVGRTGEVGDELGSQVVSAHMVRELMQVGFLMEKRYYPYSKWFGTAFNELKIAKELSPLLRKVLLSTSWKQREQWLAKAYAVVAKKHNSLHITKSLPTKVSKYYTRPYLVIHAEDFAAAVRAKIKDAEIKKLKLIGSVDQFTDSTNVSVDLKLCRKLEGVY